MGKTLFHELFSKGRGRRDSFLGISLDFYAEESMEVSSTIVTVLHSLNLPTVTLPCVRQRGETDNGALSPGTPPEFYLVIIDKMRTHG